MAWRLACVLLTGYGGSITSDCGLPRVNRTTCHRDAAASRCCRVAGVGGLASLGRDLPNRPVAGTRQGHRARDHPASAGRRNRALRHAGNQSGCLREAAPRRDARTPRHFSTSLNSVPGRPPLKSFAAGCLRPAPDCRRCSIPSMICGSSIASAACPAPRQAGHHRNGPPAAALHPAAAGRSRPGSRLPRTVAGVS